MKIPFTIISKERLKHLERCETTFISVVQCHRWFSGWTDLDIIWDYVLRKNQSMIENVRRDYANARNTDDYGRPK